MNSNFFLFSQKGGKSIDWPKSRNKKYGKVYLKNWIARSMHRNKKQINVKSAFPKKR